MSLVRAVLILLMLSGTAYYVFSTLGLRRHFRRRSTQTSIRPSFTISILKPVSGLDCNLESNLRSFMDECGDGCEILFGVLDHNDPALPLLKRLTYNCPHASVYVGSDIYGANNKVRIVHNLAQHARGEVMLITDADTRAEPGFVGRVIEPLRDASVGAVTCLYRGVDAKSLGDILEGLYMTCVFAPGVASHSALAGIDFGLGAAIAVRSEIVERAGGFGELVDYLADDFQLGRMVHKAGYRVELSSEIIDIALAGESVSSVLARDLRWSVTTRVSRPWGHVGLVFTFGFAYAVIYLISTRFAAHGWMALAGVTCLRAFAAWQGAFVCMGDKAMPRRLYLLPLRDMLSFFVWVVSFFKRTVRWRGRVLRLLKHGRISSYILALFVSWLVSGGGS